MLGQIRRGERVRRELWVAGSPWQRVYGYGYWCQGPKSIGDDGLLCYKDVDGESELVRERYLSRIYGSPVLAILSFLWLNILSMYVERNLL